MSMKRYEWLILSVFGCFSTSALAQSADSAVAEAKFKAGADLNQVLKRNGWTVLELPSSFYKPGLLFRPDSTAPEGKCVSSKPILGEMPSLESQGSKGFVVSAGARKGLLRGTAGLQATTFKLKSITAVEQSTILGINMKLNMRCIKHLRELKAAGNSLNGWFVIQETASARVREVRCSSERAAAEVQTRWAATGSLGAMQDCVRSSETQGVIAYKARPAARLLRTANQAESAKKKVEAAQLKKDRGRILAQVKQDFVHVEPMLVGEVTEGLRPVLEAFVRKYANASVEVGGKVVRLEIPEVQQVVNKLRGVKAVGVNSVGMSFIRVPAGQFLMGSPSSESGRHHGETQHPVTLSKSFSMSATEVTQRQWTAVSDEKINRYGPRSNPSNFASPKFGELRPKPTCGAQCPVENVSWLDAVKFANALSKKEGLRAAYRLSGSRVSWDTSSTGYRLPTEAEWEYAARGGESLVYAGSSTNSAVGWTKENSGSKTHKVAGKRANAWGFYDMTGNVNEWCWDRFGKYSGSSTDPVGAESGDTQVIRGGSWYHTPASARVANRGKFKTDTRDSSTGFRLVRTNLVRTNPLTLSTAALADPDKSTETSAAEAPAAEAVAEETLNMPKDPAGAKADLAAAAQAHSAGKWDEVEAKARSAVVKNPELADAWAYLAAALNQKGEHEMASQLFDVRAIRRKLSALTRWQITRNIAAETGTSYNEISSRCRPRSNMSPFASRAWLKKANNGITQLNSCAGKYKRMACSSRNSMSDVRSLSRRCVAATEALQRVTNLGCWDLHEDTAVHQLVVMGQVVYLLGQMADADKCMQRR